MILRVIFISKLSSDEKQSSTDYMVKILVCWHCATYPHPNIIHLPCGWVPFLKRFNFEKTDFIKKVNSQAFK